MIGDDKLVSRCMRCNEFKEREEMESRTAEECVIVTMCINCWSTLNGGDVL
jgi:hypothetical protein